MKLFPPTSFIFASLLMLSAGSSSATVLYDQATGRVTYVNDGRPNTVWANGNSGRAISKYDQDSATPISIYATGPGSFAECKKDKGGFMGMGRGDYKKTMCSAPMGNSNYSVTVRFMNGRYGKMPGLGKERMMSAYEREITSGQLRGYKDLTTK